MTKWKDIKQASGCFSGCCFLQTSESSLKKETVQEKQIKNAEAHYRKKMKLSQLEDLMCYKT